jgi:DNA-binding transcriptional ArsR family regulator
MPKRVKKKPEWEREENRSKIYLSLLGNPMSFSELLKKTKLARSTLSSHLKVLLNSGVIEKTIKDGIVVYQTVVDSHKLKSELMRLRLQSFMDFVAKTSPDTFEKINKLFDEWIKQIEKGSLALKKAVEYVLKRLK